ncbi:MAG TPA: C4-dicarboxylate ABC transporter [Desulfobacteraceae bacterium]|nr:C4-dicarboxylate ABC transporter [Desulfobacteraceae bacterium]|tara:strand:- start:103 stop:1128 length:1026 start_codon:yes stop_codon:yes gene_type:complete
MFTKSRNLLCFAVLAVFVQLFFTTTAFTQTFKIATISPEGSMWMEKMREGARAVAKGTQNRVKFKFYPGGVMGNDRAVLRKIRIGQLQGGAVVAGSLASFFPPNQIYSLPMKLRTIEEVDYVRQHMDEFIMQGLDKAGFVTFGISGGGFAYIMSKEPIETVGDLKNRKVWITDTDTLGKGAMDIFGITPIPLPLADVRTALSSGLIDTVATSAVGAIVLQWHTQIRYVTNIPLLYLNAVLAIDKKRFNRMSAEDRDIVSRIMTQKFKEIDLQNREDEIKAINALKGRGIQFITPKKADLDLWLSTASRASEKMVSADPALKKATEKMDLLLAEYHKANEAQ